MRAGMSSAAALALVLAYGYLVGHAAALSACDPIVPQACALPLPNDFWLRNGSVAFGNATLPLDSSSPPKPIRADYGGWGSLDGFSPLPPILAYLPNATLEGVPRLWDVAASLAAASPTVLLDATTGARVAHWAELDHSGDDTAHDEYERALIIWPAARLTPGHRYIVALRGIQSAAGGLAPASPAFAALRDGSPSSDPDVNERRAHFAALFKSLAAAGVAQKALQLAWDFTVATQPNQTGRMVHVRDDALSRIAAAGGMNFSVDAVTANYSASIHSKVQGHFWAPYYLNELWPTVHSRLVLDPATGLPVYQDMLKVDFTLLIPRSLVANGTAGPPMSYGHGLFGAQNEVQSGYLDDEANEYGYVLAAVDWMGLSAYDEVAVTWMLANDISDFAMVPDRCTQGMLNALLMMRLMKTGLAKHPALNPNGRAVIDTSKGLYYGNSQGGILGAVYMATSTDVTRGVLGVYGGPYGLLLPRSVDFSTLFLLLKLRYPSALDRMILLTAMQMLWDRLEPAGYLAAISDEPLPNTPKHRVLMHYGLGDAQVTWLGAQTVARSVGASVFESNVLEGNCTRFGLPSVKDGAVVTTGNVAVGWQFAGVPDVPFDNVPPDKQFDTHERVRREKTAQAMNARFLLTGEIVNTCGGACNNVTGW